jgi:hypothetical protein
MIEEVLSEGCWTVLLALLFNFMYSVNWRSLKDRTLLATPVLNVEIESSEDYRDLDWKEE